MLFFVFLNQIHRDLSGEAAQLMLEYNKIHLGIDTEWMHTYVPECWAALVPLKAEYYKGKSVRLSFASIFEYNFVLYLALAHYHAALSIDVSDSTLNTKDKLKRCSTIGLIDSSEEPCPDALKKVHIKESMACHEEAQRLQRMCRDLKVEFSADQNG